MTVARVPSEQTLRRYGLTEGEWRGILARQGGVCAICRRVPSSGRLCIDHEHVPGWAKKPPEERKRFVRGLLCALPCNHRFAGKGMTAERARNLARYLAEYRARAYGLAEDVS